MEQNGHEQNIFNKINLLLCVCIWVCVDFIVNKITNFIYYIWVYIKDVFLIFYFFVRRECVNISVKILKFNRRIV